MANGINTVHAYVGSVANCRKNIVGVIAYKRDETYYGFTLKGKSWQSKSPTILAHSIEDYYKKYYKME